MQESEELIVKRSDTRFKGNKPYCPKCNSEKDEVIITNIYLSKFKCLRCKIAFTISD